MYGFDICDSFSQYSNFGESLPVSAAQLAVEESNKADLALVLGTSMRVHPACDMPLLADNLVICNLQKTPYDKLNFLTPHTLGLMRGAKLMFSREQTK